MKTPRPICDAWTGFASQYAEGMNEQERQHTHAAFYAGVAFLFDTLSTSDEFSMDFFRSKFCDDIASELHDWRKDLEKGR